MVSSVEKKGIRAQLLTMRKNIDEKESCQKSKKIVEHFLSTSLYHNSKHILLYYPKGREVDTKEIITKAIEDKKHVLLPKLQNNKIEVGEITNQVTDLVMGKYGILEPKKSPTKVQPDVIVVPGVGFDLRGNRVGYGQGYYDKFLQNTSAIRVGLAYRFQVVEEMPLDTHDVPMNYIITEEGIVECKNDRNS